MAMLSVSTTVELLVCTNEGHLQSTGALRVYISRVHVFSVFHSPEVAALTETLFGVTRGRFTGTLASARATAAHLLETLWQLWEPTHRSNKQHLQHDMS